jgi:hypothetical protein
MYWLHRLSVRTTPFHGVKTGSIPVGATKLWYHLDMEKTYLDEAKKVWIIEDFLTEEELAWFKTQTDDINGWYPTMRSPYRNILNKFLNIVPKYNADGNIEFPNEASQVIDLPIFSKPGGVWDRLDSVLPAGYKRHATLQTFKYMTDEEIVENVNNDLMNEYGVDRSEIDFSMYWHQDPGIEHNILASFSLYLNDDFDGGELEFKNLPIKVKPKAGMLAVIPGGEKYMHRVNKVLGPNSRHTLYGNSFVNPDLAPVSTADDC